MNVLVFGGMGSGKIIFLNIFLGFILVDEWMVIIEDVVEL